MAKELLIPAERIERSILLIRGQKVMLDSDLAELYGVTTKAFNQAVKRNAKRFPADFMFQLAADEADSLRSQFVTLKLGRGQHRKYLPFAFTEQGVAMLSGILNSDRAIEVNIAIMRAFVRLREILSSHKDLARKLDELEKKVGQQDDKIHAVFEAIRQLMSPPPRPRNAASASAPSTTNLRRPAPPAAQRGMEPPKHEDPSVADKRRRQRPHPGLPCLTPTPHVPSPVVHPTMAEGLATLFRALPALTQSCRYLPPFCIFHFAICILTFPTFATLAAPRRPSDTACSLTAEL